MIGADSWVALGERVAVAAVAAAALAVLVALVLRLLPSLSPRLRAGLWWLVAARTLLELAGAPALELAWLPAVPRSSKLERVADFAAAAPTLVRAPADRPSARLESFAANEPVAANGPVDSSFPGRARTRRAALSILAGLWSLSALAAGGLAWRGHRRLRRRVASARPVEEGATLALLQALRAELGPARPVRLLRCERSTTPHVVGWWRPAIVLPATELTAEELRLALAHELLHLRRGDALRGLVPWLAERLFAGHPAVRWAAREYVLANECACDAEVLARLGASPARYGRLLLRLAAPVPADATAAAAGWALARRPIERRLVMLVRSTSPHRPARGALVAVALLALLAAWPLRLVGAVAAEGVADTPTPTEASEATPSASVEATLDAVPEPTPLPEARAETDAQAAPSARPARLARTPRPPTPPRVPAVPRAAMAAMAPMAPMAPMASVTPTVPALPVALREPSTPRDETPAAAPLPPPPPFAATPALPALAPVAPRSPRPTLLPTPPPAPLPPLPPMAEMAPVAPAAPMAPMVPTEAMEPVPPVAPAARATPAVPATEATPAPRRGPLALPAPPTPRALRPPPPPVPPLAGFGLGADARLVLLDGDATLTIDATDDLLDLAERSRRGGEAVLVVAREGRTRIVHDREAIGSLVGLIDAQRRLAEQQAEVAEGVARRLAEVSERSMLELAAELERRQGEIVALQERLARRQWEIESARAADLVRLQAELSGEQREQLRDVERRSEALRRALDERLRELLQRGEAPAP